MRSSPAIGPCFRRGELAVEFVEGTRDGRVGFGCGLRRPPASLISSWPVRAIISLFSARDNLCAFSTPPHYFSAPTTGCSPASTLL